MAHFFIENYGCQMNVSEADSIRRLLQSGGHTETESEKDADVVIINTCSVRKTAEIKIEGRLGYYRGLKDNEDKAIQVILMGCMAQNVGPRMKKKFPDVVKLVWGTYNKHGILDFVNHLGEKNDFLDLDNYRFMDAEPSEKFFFKSFVPISHGCNNFCSYCIVPFVRGREIHRDSRETINNIRRLIDQGVHEIILLGQNVNSYSDGKYDFPDLLAEVASIEGVKRAGFLTSHPKDFSQKLVDTIKAHSNISRSIHLPLQSGNDRILGLMNRKYTASEYMEKVAMAREIPNLTLSTDIIVGFPSETEEEFQDTIRIVEKVAYHEAFMYHYNMRPGTIAERYEEQTGEAEKLDRLARLIKLQLSITRKLLEQDIGKESTVLFESVSKKDKKQLTGRSSNNIPVVVEGESRQIGTFEQVKFTGVRGNALTGEIVPR